MEKLAGLKKEILQSLKDRGPGTIPEMSGLLKVTREGVRRALLEMSSEGWVKGEKEPSPRAGRPSRRFKLTLAGEHLFPKAYDALSLELMDRMGKDALRETLTAMTDARVREWEPRLKGRPLPERLRKLKGLYMKADPHMNVEKSAGEALLVERNCPFMNIAAQRPALCSVTVSALTRLLGRKVERVESFQAGHGRCVFRVKNERPGPFRFEFEKPTVLPPNR